VQKLISENAPWVRELRRQSHTDATTGLATRSYFDEELAKRLEAPTLLLLIKPDRFKELVDERGHAAGDAAMSAIAALLIGTIRELGRGHAIRIKSNETALVVPRCGKEEARELARRISQGFATLDAGPCCPGFHPSPSISLGFWPEHGKDPSRLFDAVYGLLQRAWRDGGNRAYSMRTTAGKPPEGLPERRRSQEGPG
jgi:diguanylate cyclase (GGDEF)-like protein